MTANSAAGAVLAILMESSSSRPVKAGPFDETAMTIERRKVCGTHLHLKKKGHDSTVTAIVQNPPLQMQNLALQMEGKPECLFLAKPKAKEDVHAPKRVETMVTDILREKVWMVEM